MKNSHAKDRFTVLALCLLGAMAVAQPVQGQVVINEILADPASDWDGNGVVDTREDEWIEIINRGAGTVDLADYWVRDEAVDTPRMQLGGTLEPGAVAVFFGSDAVAWQEATGLSGSGLSLNNAGDQVVLLRTVPGSEPLATEAVDTVTYPDHTADDDRSCGWDTLGGEWLLFDGLAPYGGELDPVGTGCPPTPGEVNLCHGEVAAETVNFGSAKARYR